MTRSLRHRASPLAFPSLAAFAVAAALHALPASATDGTAHGDTHSGTHSATERPDESAPAQALDNLTVVGERTPDYGVDSSLTAAKAEVPLLKLPQAVTVLPEELLDDQAAENLVDALRNVSGITEANTFGGTFDNFLIRGFETGSGAVLRDSYRTISLRALSATTQRVEVLKGPSSLLFGRFEPGGVVNVVSKKPLPQFSAEVSTRHSSEGGSRQMLDVTGPLGGGFSYRFVAEYEDSDYWRNVGADRERLLLAPSLAWAGGSWDVLLQYEFLDSDQPFDRGRVFFNGSRVPTPPRRSFAEDFAKLEENIHSGTATVSYRFNDALRVETRAALQGSRGGDLQIRPLGLATDDNGEITGNLRRRVDGNRGRFEDRFYGSVNLHADFTTGALGHQLIAGVDYEDSDNGDRFQVRSAANDEFNIFDPVYGLFDEAVRDIPVASGDPDGIRFRSELTTVGVYLQDIISIGSRWTAVLGARFEDFEDFSSFLDDTLDDSSDTALLPRFGLVFQPQPRLSLYASYSESFTPNASVPPVGDEPAQGPFDPERGRAFEVGAKTELFAGFTATAAAYYIKKENVLTTLTDPQGVPVTTASEEVTSRGFELDVAGEILPDLSVVASYAYTDARDDQSASGDEVVNVAPHTASASLRYRLRRFLPGAYLGGGAFYRDARFGGTTAGATEQEQPPFFLPGFTIFDLYAGYEGRPLRMQQTVFGRIAVRNLTNKDYDQSSGGALRVLPGQTRTVFVTAGLRFD